MWTTTREIQFDAGHRIIGHENKCAMLHGHRYRALIEVSADYLDGVGRVVDFGRVKELVGGWVDEYWDHNMLLRHDDPLIDCPQVYQGQRLYVMQDNPTAENLARDLLMVSCRLLDGLTVRRVRLYETPNCYADYYDA